MKTEPQRTCPSCGNEWSGAMEFCPVCMLRKGLAGSVESGESSTSEDMVKPTPRSTKWCESGQHSTWQTVVPLHEQLRIILH